MAIEVVDPDPTWARQFQEIGRWLRSAFGDRALRIDHIGSTAVPGLPAKDVIDVQLTVEVLEGVRGVLEGSAFALRTGTVSDHRPAGSDVPDRDLVKLFAEASEPRRVNLHVRLPGRFNQRYPILCRDYLRAHRGAAQAYGEVKRQLARIVGDDVEAYYDVKDPVFDIVMAGAEAWAARTGWAPGPGDS
jgi:GrpB-like predicted nucleotidyltransferase (UPF0157 family)